MNAPSELEEPFLKQLNTIAKDGGTDICLFFRFQALWKVLAFSWQTVTPSRLPISISLLNLSKYLSSGIGILGCATAP